MRFARFITGMALAGSICLGVAATTQADTPDQLEFVPSDSLSVSFDGQGTAPAVLVGVQNSGAARQQLVFDLLLSRKSTPVTNEITVVATPAGVDQNRVAWFSLTFSRVSGDGDVGGILVARDAANAAEPAAREIAFVTDQRVIKIGQSTITIFGAQIPGGPGGVLLIAAILAGLAVLSRVLVGKLKFRNTDVGLPTWDSSSLITSFTLVGAALGTVLGKVLPDKDSADLLTAAQYDALHVVSAGLVLLSPLCFAAFHRASQERESGGKTVAVLPTSTGVLFLLMAWAVFTGAIVEVLTLLVGFADVASSLESQAVVLVMAVLGILAIAAMMVYGSRATDTIYETPAPKKRSSLAQRVKPTDGDSPTRFSMF